MATLRVLLPAAPRPDRADAWALVDAQERVVRSGRGAPGDWPASARREAVLAADAVRVVALSLPPLPAARVAGAAAYALEERLATPMEDATIVAGPQRADGRVVAVVVSRTLAAAVARAAFARVVAEPQLAPPAAPDQWRWCASPDGGFVLTADGDAFAVAAGEPGVLPPELALALEHAARSGRAPMRVVAQAPDAAAHRDAWTRATGVPFEAGPAWRWDSASGASALDLAPAFARAIAPVAMQASRPSPYAVAATLLVAAGLLHVAATAATWGWQRIELARTQDAIAAIAQEAGVRDAVSTGAAPALARVHALASHRAGRAVPDDAWPLLARAAPALHALPAGTLRSARFASGAWTLDLAPVDEAVLAPFDARLRRAGLSAVAARAPGGVRVRVDGGG